MSWVDDSGLSYFWGKIKAKLDAITQRLDVIDPPYENLFEINLSLPGYPNTSGVMQPQTTYMDRTSDYIPVEAGKKYTVQVWHSGDISTYPPWVCIQLYDSSYNLVGQHTRGETGVAHYTTVVNMQNYAGAAWMRVASRYIDPYGYYTYCKVMVEEGEVAHDYVMNDNDNCYRTYYSGLGAGCYLTVLDRVCVLEINASVNLSGSWTDVTLNATIPARFRPRQGTHRAPCVSQNTGGRCANFNVGTDGSIHVTGTGGSAIGSQTVVGTLTWIC